MISKVIVAVVIRPFPKQFQAHHCALRKIIHKWKTSETPACSSRFTLRSHCAMFKRAPSWTLQASVRRLNVEVHDSTIF